MNNKEKMQCYEEALAECALAYPEDKIVNFLLGLAENHKAEIEQLAVDNCIFKDRLESYLDFIEANRISSYEGFLSAMAPSQDRFLQRFAESISSKSYNVLTDLAKLNPLPKELDSAKPKVNIVGAKKEMKPRKVGKFNLKKQARIYSSIA